MLIPWEEASDHAVPSVSLASDERLNRIPIPAVAEGEPVWDDAAQFSQIARTTACDSGAGLFTAMISGRRLKRPISVGLNRKCVVLGLS